MQIGFEALRILYVASAIEAGGTSGGWTHVTEVACGLADLGHDVRVIARGTKSGRSPSKLNCGVPIKTVWLPQQLAIAGLPIVAREFGLFKPDVVMERFYNFAGAGVLLAHRHGVPIVLEVNAPMVDPPGSRKTKVDRVLLGSMRRWAVRQGRWSDAIVTPLASTVPPQVTRRKIQELPWGANIERFDPSLRERDKEKLGQIAGGFGLDASVPIVAFLGSFRAWHGVSHFAEAARRLLMRGCPLAFLAIGGGPELAGLKEQVRGWDLPPGRFVFAGPQPNESVPDLLALASIGVAPFDLSAYAPLTTFGFYWSPLKVFEYMAMGLPIVTIDVTPLNEIVRQDKEGLLYKSGDIAGLVRSLDRLACDPALRDRLGRSGRARVIQRYSWRSHCLALERILKDVTHSS